MDHPDDRQGMDLFSIASWSYAPSNLRHLRPPVPNDLPPDHDATIFTFEDALEDLLAMTQGGALPDIDIKYSQRRLLRQMYPNGEPTWFWLRRLQSQGLLQGTRAFGHRMLDPDDFGSFGRKIIDQAFSRLQWPDWDDSRDPFGRRARDTVDQRPRMRPIAELNEREYFDELANSIHDGFHGSRDDNRWSHSSRETEGDETRESHPEQHKRLLPDTFEDLYSAIASGLEEGQKHWDTFMKTITDHKHTPAPASEEKTRQKNWQDTTDQTGGNKEVVTRDEHVDRNGYLHTTVTRKTYDRDGNQIGTSTHFTMRPAGRKGADGDESQSDLDFDDHDAYDDDVIDRTEPVGHDQEKPENRKQQQHEKKPGWFWK